MTELLRFGTIALVEFCKCTVRVCFSMTVEKVVSIPLDEQTVQRLQENFSLLCEIIREPAKEQKLKADLSRIETIIQEEIPEALKKNAPEDFYVLYSDFKDEYDRFRDFILYDKLIGKNVVALGGGFSSGKSSFLNALMGGRKIPMSLT